MGALRDGMGSECTRTRCSEAAAARGAVGALSAAPMTAPPPPLRLLALVDAAHGASACDARNVEERVAHTSRQACFWAICRRFARARLTPRRVVGDRARLAETGSQKLQHGLGGFKHQIRLYSITRGLQTKYSSDLERAAAARSIAAYFVVCNPIVKKLQRCEDTRFSPSRCTFWDPDSVHAHGRGPLPTLRHGRDRRGR